MNIENLVCRSLILMVLMLSVEICSKSINNSKTAKLLEKAAVTVPEGNYQISNLQTGHKLHYTSDDEIYSIFPASKTTKKITMKKHSSGTPYMRISVGTKCGSAQWTTKEGGVDNAMVLYECIGKGGTGTLEPDKQQWLIVPADLKSKRSQGFAERLNYQLEEQRSLQNVIVQNSTLVERSEKVSVDDTEGEDQKEAKVKGLSVRTSKSSKSLGPYYIIPMDHIKDMETRALTSAAIKTPGGALSTTLDSWKKGEKSQLWYFTKA